jgi:hypothetical protein
LRGVKDGKIKKIFPMTGCLNMDGIGLKKNEKVK